MGSLEVQTLDPSSYYAFRQELDEAGFQTKDGGKTWTGPIAEPLRAFTSSDEMRIIIRDGWPYLHPELEVPDMDSVEHVDQRGYVCLWAPGDRSQSWRTLAGWHERIRAWAERQSSGFAAADATMDAHAYFGSADGLATIDPGDFASEADGAAGEAWGRWRRAQGLLEIERDRNAGGKVRGTWFYRESIPAPPTTMERLAALLTKGQAERLERLIGAVARDKKKQRRFVVLAWGEGTDFNALVVVLAGRGDGSTPLSTAVEVAPTDLETLLSRAGRDAPGLRTCRVAVFGAGSVGSHVALLLGESGVGTISIIDYERLRPGNVVRHIAGESFVGAPKVEAVKAVVEEHAPWTSVTPIRSSPWSPERLREEVAGHDLIVDATGIGGLTDQLSALAAQAQIPFVSVALYRQGAVARVQRQAAGDTPILERDDEKRYPVIPPGDADEELQQEAGCSAPVNRASPRAVMSGSVLAAEVIVDALNEQLVYPDEVTDVLEALDEAPFDRTGRLTSA